MKCWDNYNKQWLKILEISFDLDGSITRIKACKESATDIISDGFYIINKESLQHLEINETILLNHKK